MKSNSVCCIFPSFCSEIFRLSFNAYSNFTDGQLIFQLQHMLLDVSLYWDARSRFCLFCSLHNRYYLHFLLFACSRFPVTMQTSAMGCYFSIFSCFFGAVCGPRCAAGPSDLPAHLRSKLAISQFIIRVSMLLRQRLQPIY